MMSNNELWNVRKKLYALYDIESMSNNARDRLIRRYNIIKSYNLDLNSDIIDRLNEIRNGIEDRIKEDRVEGIRLLDTILTLIAIVKSNNKKALEKIITVNELIEEGLFNGNIEQNISKKKEELENRIIELKMRYYQ